MSYLVEKNKKDAMIVDIDNTSSLVGGEIWYKGFSTGFAGSIVGGTETYITDSNEILLEESLHNTYI